MDEPEGPTPVLSADIETEIKELMGLFDVPAFARRGQEVEYSQRRVHDRCHAARKDMLEMVRMRLRQWARSVTGPDDSRGVFTAPIDPLWPLSDADAPRWAQSPASARRQLAIAHDLIAAVLRFNARWDRFLEHVDLDPRCAQHSCDVG